MNNNPQFNIGQSSASLPDPHYWTDSRSILWASAFSIYEALVKSMIAAPGSFPPGFVLEGGKRMRAPGHLSCAGMCSFRTAQPARLKTLTASIQRAAGPGMPVEYGTEAFALYLPGACQGGGG